MNTALAMAIILHGSLTVCDAFRLPEVVSHMFQKSEMISCDLQVKIYQPQVKELLMPPLKSRNS